MNGQYIKIISDGTEMFLQDTECFICLDGKFVRPTVEQFLEFIKRGCSDFLGQHQVTWANESNVRKIPIGTIIWDMEWCNPTEFYFEYDTESCEVDYQSGTVIR